MRATLTHYSDHEWGDRPLWYLLAYPPVGLLAAAMEWGGRIRAYANTSSTPSPGT
ncbi:hypothetical protein ACH4OW_33595 [Streptomyces sp. NPDC017056]|uniref:hypothetical protein n=1 Tax=Streptomyces sp. NPDC017056 TaxID=3364973 RepID=UPI0037982D8A